MTSLFDKLNLRPGERRLVVIAGGVVFIFLNLLLVFPHFGDLGEVQRETNTAQTTLQQYQQEIQRKAEYDRQLNDLAEEGAEVAESARALELQREVSNQALLCGVPIGSFSKTRMASNAKTNAFFDEQQLSISVNTGEKELLCFLFNLAERSSLIRVRSMTLRPDPKRYRLQGNIKLVASYQKPGSSLRTTTTTPSATKPAAKPPSKATATPKPPATPPSASSRTKPPSPGTKPTAIPKRPTSAKPSSMPTRQSAMPNRATPTKN